MRAVLRDLHEPKVRLRSSWLRRGALLIPLCLLAACGGSTSSASKVESAISSSRVGDLFAAKTGLRAVTAPVCQSTTLPGNYTCTGKPTFVACPRNASPTTPCATPTAPTRIWIGCYPTTGKYAYFCQRENAPPGTNVFVTPAQRAAKKSAEWKCLAKTIDGGSVGPLTLTTAQSFGPVETQPDYVTRAQAEAFANKLHVRLAIDCA